jgi:hypothetical protein
LMRDCRDNNKRAEFMERLDNDCSDVGMVVLGLSEMHDKSRPSPFLI